MEDARSFVRAIFFSTDIMNTLQSLYNIEKTIPEVDNLAGFGWSCCVQVLLECPFIRILEDHIILEILDIASVEAYQATIDKFPQLPESIHFVVIVFNCIGSDVCFECKGIYRLVI